MSFIVDFLGRLLFPNSEESPPPKKLNPLYSPKKLTKTDAEMCEKLMDNYMTKQGYRKYLAGKDIPRPKRRRRSKMEVGDTQTMSRITKIEGQNSNIRR